MAQIIRIWALAAVTIGLASACAPSAPVAMATIAAPLAPSPVQRGGPVMAETPPPSGAVPDKQPVTNNDGTNGECGAPALQHLVGQNRSVLATMRFSQPVRIVQAGEPVTMDFSANRLNIIYDASGRIIRVSCG